MAAWHLCLGPSQKREAPGLTSLREVSVPKLAGLEPRLVANHSQVHCTKPTGESLFVRALSTSLKADLSRQAYVREKKERMNDSHKPRFFE
jgi:hypothetical protein